MTSSDRLAAGRLDSLIINRWYGPPASFAIAKDEYLSLKMEYIDVFRLAQIHQLHFIISYEESPN